ncbi:hypothetical protein V4B17_05230 [Bartonella sp. B23]
MHIETIAYIVTEIDTSEKHASALDDVVSAFVLVTLNGDAALSDLDCGFLISKTFLFI